MDLRPWPLGKALSGADVGKWLPSGWDALVGLPFCFGPGWGEASWATTLGRWLMQSFRREVGLRGEVGALKT